jgi:putative acetyltransferase
LLEIRVVPENLGLRPSLRNQAHNSRYGDTYTTDAWNPAHLPGIDSDAIEIRHAVASDFVNADYTALRPLIVYARPFSRETLDVAMLEIRVAGPEDDDAIAEVNRQAFAQENEGRLAAAICESAGHIPELNLVAFQDGQLVGHILFSQIVIETADGNVPALALAPMAVLPRRQRRGIGSALVRTGLDRARELGHKIVIVVGHPEYYPRFGFVPAGDCNIEPPFPVPREACMALELVPGALAGLRGTLRYPAAFNDV